MINKKIFGYTKNGQEVHSYILTNGKGENAAILDFGGIIQSIKVLDKNGRLSDVVLGYDTFSEYENDGCFFGALVGRYANRIGKAKFTLNGKTYSLFKNDGNNHLHGGKEGYNKKIWQASVSGDELELRLFSKDTEEGYPGNLDIKVVYSFSDSGSLDIKYFASCDSDTVINLTNHSYFNLGGKAESILSHKLKINADEITEIDAGLIPTGKLINIAGTPFDFREYKEIGRDIGADNRQLVMAKGYDHNYVLSGTGYRLVCGAECESSGIRMEVYTDMEGMQFYSGNFLAGTKGKGNAVYYKNYGFCLETQHFPDSINQPSFPSPVLKKGALYSFRTAFKFNSFLV